MTHRNLMSLFVVGTFVVLGAHGHATAQSTLFKCTDDKGITHYGETMPAVCAKKEVTELSKQGRTLRKLDAPLTLEQQKARDEANAKKAADDQKVNDQRQKDMALLGTFGSERELDAIRDKDFAQMAQRRKFLENRLVDIDTRLVKVNNQMEFYVAGKSKTAKTKDGKTNVREIPSQLQADYDRVKSDQSNVNAEIARLDEDKAAAAARFETEKDRFRRLKSGMRPGTILDDKGNVLIDAPVPSRVVPSSSSPPPLRFR